MVSLNLAHPVVVIIFMRYASIPSSSAQWPCVLGDPWPCVSSPPTHCRCAGQVRWQASTGSMVTMSYRPRRPIGNDSLVVSAVGVVAYRTHDHIRIQHERRNLRNDPWPCNLWRYEWWYAIVTARCYAERGIPTVKSSVRLCVRTLIVIT